MVEFSYKNEGCRMVVLRCIGPSNFFLERVLFPTDILTFMAPNDSRVEIWGNELYGPKLEERIRISADNEDSTLVAQNRYYLIVFESKFFTNTQFLLILSNQFQFYRCIIFLPLQQEVLFLLQLSLEFYFQLGQEPFFILVLKDPQIIKHELMNKLLFNFS